VAGNPYRLIYRAEAQLGDKVRRDIANVINTRLFKFVKGTK